MRTKFLFLSFILSFSLFSQNNYWRADYINIDNEVIPADRIPKQYRAFEVDIPAIQNVLFTSPLMTENIASTINFAIPDENGKLVNFKIYRSTTLPELLKSEHNIFTYRGYSSGGDIASIVISPLGLQIGVLRPNKSDLVIEPATRDLQHNIVYTKDQAPYKAFQCFTDSEPVADISDSVAARIDDNLLRTYRFAVGTTGEYSEFHVNRAVNMGVIPANATDAQKKSVVLAAVTETIDRVNSVYERDFGVTLELVANETNAIFLNPNTDPYDNSDIMSMLNGNTGVLNNHIGSSNYDGGHVFSTYAGGGISGLGIICSSGKGRSVTGSTNPRTDSYDIDFVAHEIGHAFGCNHTFANSCGGNRNLSTSVEPGSGSSIMAYAGVCSPNVQLHSDDYFNIVSIEEAGNFITQHATCSVNTNIGNHAPNISVVNYGITRIPKSTPFMLTATATDQEANDVLTYCWEEIDAVTNNNAGSWVPDETNTYGPAFRSYNPTTNNTRYFPKMTNILNSTYGNTWEKLPTVNRSLHFSVTVRDNHPGGGQSPSANLQFRVDANSGPFRVTNMSNGETLQAGSQKTITWDVAGTNSGVVNCSTVDILLSVDNGATFPVTVASNLPNNGSATFTVPGYQDTHLGRFMVKAHDNYFFDMAKGRFTIQGSGEVVENNLNNLNIYPNPANQTVHISFDVANKTDDVNVKMYDLSGREVYSKTFEATNQFNHTIDVEGYARGVYFVRIDNGNQNAAQKLILE